MKPSIKTQSQLRAAFWDQCEPGFERVKGWIQNQYPTDVRVSFVDFVDGLAREGHISEALAHRATL